MNGGMNTSILEAFVPSYPSTNALEKFVRLRAQHNNTHTPPAVMAAHVLSSNAAAVAGSGIEDLYPLVSQLTNPDLREHALLELSKKRESYPDLAIILWQSFGTIAALLQEIVSIYPMLSPPTLTPAASNRVCNALALLQCVASHTETKTLLMNGTCVLQCMWC